MEPGAATTAPAAGRPPLQLLLGFLHLQARRAELYGSFQDAFRRFLRDREEGPYKRTIQAITQQFAAVSQEVRYGCFSRLQAGVLGERWKYGGVWGRGRPGARFGMRGINAQSRCPARRPAAGARSRAAGALPSSDSKLSKHPGPRARGRAGGRGGAARPGGAPAARAERRGRQTQASGSPGVFAPLLIVRSDVGHRLLGCC